MKRILTALAATGMVGIAKADRRRVDPYTCACGPQGGPQTVTVTQTVSVPAPPSGYGGHNATSTSVASPLPSAFTLSDRPGTYTNSVITITVTRPGGQTELSTSSTAVPANSTLVSPIQTSPPPPPLPKTTYSPSVVTITVTDVVGRPSILTTSTKVPVPSVPYYPIPGNSSIISPSGSIGLPYSTSTAQQNRTEVSPIQTSELPPGVTVTERTSVYVTTCSEETTITSGSYTITSTGTSLIRSTITSTIQATVTAFIPGQRNSTTLPIETSTSINGTLADPIGSTRTPHVSTKTVIPIEASRASTSRVVSSYGLNTTTSSSTLTSATSSSQTSFSFVPTTNSSLASPESTGPSYAVPSGYASNTMNSTSTATSVENSPVQTTSLSSLVPPSYGGGHTSATHPTNSSGVSPVGTSSVPKSASTSVHSYSAPANMTSALPTSTEKSPVGTSTTSSSHKSQSTAPANYERRVLVSPIAPDSAEIPGLDTPTHQLDVAQAHSLDSPGFVSQPGAPACNLAPGYGSALTNLTAALPSNSLSLAIPEAHVDAVVAGLFLNINAALEAHIDGAVQLKTSLPSALPTFYINAYGDSLALNYEGGMSLANILDWCAYLLVQVYVDAGAVLEGFAEGSAEFGGNFGLSGSISFSVDFAAGLGTAVGAQGGFGFGAGVRGGLEGVGELVAALDAQVNAGGM